MISVAGDYPTDHAPEHEATKRGALAVAGPDQHSGPEWE